MTAHDNSSSAPRRLRSVPVDGLPDAPETAASVLPGSPRVAALDALLREVDTLRLALETDLGAAADAVEAGDVSMARALIDSDLDGLHRFEDQALGHLSALSAVAAPRHRRGWWTRVPAAPFVAAAALVGFLVGVVPNELAPATSDTTSTVSANSKLGQLTQLAASGASASQIRAASNQLHAELAPLIAAARSNPDVAQQVLAWLAAERQVLQSSGDSSAIDALLRQSQALTRSVTAALPRTVLPSVSPPAVVAPVVVASASPSPRPTATKATPKPSSSPQASPTAKPSRAPSTGPSPSSSPTSAGPVLPSSPGLNG